MKWLQRLSIVSLTVALYVALRISVSLHSNYAPSCWQGGSCERVLSSRFAFIGSAPVSVVGALAVALLILMVVFAPPTRNARWQWFVTSGFVAIAIVALGFQAVSILVIRAVCVMCLTYCTAVIVACVCGVPSIMAKSPPLRFQGRVEALVLAAAAICIHAALFVDPARPLRVASFAPLEREMSSLSRSEVVRPLPRSSAREALVAFVDPACGHCQEVMPRLLQAAAAGTRVELQIRWFVPKADSQSLCAIVNKACDENRCIVAIRAAFRPTSADSVSLDPVVAQLGFTAVDKALALMPNSSSLQRVARDNFLAKSMGVTSTPVLIWRNESGRCLLVESDSAIRLLSSR